MAKLKELAQFAEKNPYTLDDMLEISNGTAPPPGDTKDYVYHLPLGDKVVFTHELQPGGVGRHLSMSVPRVNKFPSIVAVQMIMDALGFKNALDKCKVWTEEISKDHEAINIFEFI